MATITSMAFRITSSYNGEGLARARRDISGLDSGMNALTKSSQALVPGMKDLVATALALGPALVPITGGLLGIGAAAGSAMVSAGAAVGIYALAMKGAIKETIGAKSAFGQTGTALNTAEAALAKTAKGTKEYDKALEKVTELEKAHTEAIQAMPPVQEAFAVAYEESKDAISQFNSENAKFTLGPATTMLDTFTASLPKFSEVLKAMAPEIQRIADLTKAWVTNGGLDRFIKFLIDFGVPAFRGFVDATRSLFGALGTGMRDTAPLGQGFTDWLVRTMDAFKGWAEGGGFQRFLEWLNTNKGTLIQTAKDLGTFLANVGQSVNDMSGASFVVLGTFFKVLASFPPGLLTALTYAFISITIAMKLYAVAAFIAAAATTAMSLAAAPFGLLMIGAALTIGAVIAAIVALAVGIFFLVKYWDTVWSALTTAAIAVWNALKVAWEATWNVIKAVAMAVWDWLTHGWGQLALAFMGPIGLFILVWKHWDMIWGGIQKTAATVWGWLKTAWSATTGWLHDAFFAAIRPIQEMWDTVWPEIQRVAENAWGVLKAAWSVLWAGMRIVWEVFWSLFGPTFKAGWEGLTKTATAAWDLLKAAWELVWSVIQGTYRTAWAVLSGAWSIGWTFLTETAKIAWAVFTGAWKVLWSIVTGTWDTFYATFSAIFSAAWKTITAIATGVWNVIKAAWDALWKVVTAIFMTFLALFTGNWSGAWNAIKDAAAAIWNLIKVAFQAFLNVLKTAMDGFISVVKAAWSAFWTAVQATAATFWNALRNLFQTMLTAVQTLWNTAWTAVRNIFQTIVNAIMTIAQNWWATFRAALNTFLEFIKALWNTAWTTVQTMFKAAVDGLATVAAGLWTTIRQIFSAGSTWLLTTFWNPVKNFFTQTIPAAFKTGVDALGKAWAGLKKLVRDPIQAIVNVVYNNGIVKLWNAVASVFGADKLTAFTLPAFGEGGPTGHGSRKGFPAVIHPDEHVWTSAEVKAAGGHEEVAKLRAMVLGRGMNRVNIFGGANGRFQDGGGLFGTGFGPDVGPDLTPDGIIKDIGSAIGSVVTKLKNVVLGGVLTVIKPAINAAVKAAQTAVRGIIPGSPMLEDLAVKIPRKMGDVVLDWIKGKDVAPVGVGGTLVGAIPKGAHLAIINAALKAAGVPPPGTLGQWQKGLNTLITRESGWNPNAQNNWDSNAAAGMASRGLAQVIPPTFASNHVPGTSNNIFDPVANVAAAIRYITRRYGNITNVQQANASLPPKGYARGTYSAFPGWGMVGENGVEIMHMRGGERIRPIEGMTGRGDGGVNLTVSVYAPGATHSVVDRLNNELPDKLRMALEQGTGRRP